MDVIKFIPVGHKNAVSREYLARVTGLTDRQIRMEIHLARRERPIINLSDGSGYYIPDMDDAFDRLALSEYVRQEESRIKSTGWALKAARQALHPVGK